MAAAIVDETHPIVAGDGNYLSPRPTPDLPLAVRDEWQCGLAKDCTHAVVWPIEPAQLQCFLRFWCRDSVLYVGDVWVAENLRRRGVALDLFDRIIEQHEVTTIKSHPVTAKGRAYWAKLQDLYASRFEFL